MDIDFLLSHPLSDDEHRLLELHLDRMVEVVGLGVSVVSIDRELVVRAQEFLESRGHKVVVAGIGRPSPSR